MAQLSAGAGESISRKRKSCAEDDLEGGVETAVVAAVDVAHEGGRRAASPVPIAIPSNTRHASRLTEVCQRGFVGYWF